MSYPSIKVANELLSLHGDVSPMKLQKLLYYANGWWLALNGRPLLSEEPQVWRYGPVYQHLYRMFSRFGHNNIGGPVKGNPFVPEPERLGGSPEENQVKQLLEWIWDEHGEKTAMQLSDETHAVGTPWRDIAEKYGFKVPYSVDISPERDWKFFAELAKKRGMEPAQFRTKADA